MNHAPDAAWVGGCRVGARMAVKVLTRGGAAALVGVRGERLVVRVNAPPVGGRANAEICAFLAKTLGVAKGVVAIERGRTSDKKSVTVEGMTPVDIAAVIEPLLPKEDRT